jgi:beta-lactamase superfamily II metal-dependent hydrolase
MKDTFDSRYYSKRHLNSLIMEGSLAVFTLKIIQAFEGDCLLIRYGEHTNITNLLIDGGTGRTYVKNLRDELNHMVETNKFIDLLIVTHIDDDHIGGIVECFRDSSIDKSIFKKVWFNSERLIASSNSGLDIIPVDIDLGSIDATEMSYTSANNLEAMLEGYQCWDQNLIQFNPMNTEYKLNGASLTVLSPRWDAIVRLGSTWKRDQPDERQMAARNDYSVSIEELALRPFIEDESITNKSSISFVLEYSGKKLLLLGDSHPSDIIQSLRDLGYSEDRKISLNYVKLSHHGSKRNINIALLDLIDCNQFIISTNGSRHGLPNKECLSRIVKSRSGVRFYFNYDIGCNIFSSEEMKEYNFDCIHVNELEV